MDLMRVSIVSEYLVVFLVHVMMPAVWCRAAGRTAALHDCHQRPLAPGVLVQV